MLLCAAEEHGMGHRREPAFSNKEKALLGLKHDAAGYRHRPCQKGEAQEEGHWHHTSTCLQRKQVQRLAE